MILIYGCLGGFMLKNNKGFTLMEILMVVFILSTLASIGIPQYINSVNKTKISLNLPLLRTLQNDIVMYYNRTESLPTKLSQLSMDPKEFSGDLTTTATQKSSGCTFELKTNYSGYAKVIIQDCGKGWQTWYTVKSSSLGYSADKRIFKITGNVGMNTSLAKSFGWDQNGSNSDEYLIK